MGGGFALHCGPPPRRECERGIRLHSHAGDGDDPVFPGGGPARTGELLRGVDSPTRHSNHPLPLVQACENQRERRSDLHVVDA